MPLVWRAQPCTRPTCTSTTLARPVTATGAQSLAITLDHFNTRPLQERALDILQFKLDILWAMNDAMALKYGVNA